MTTAAATHPARLPVRGWLLAIPVAVAAFVVRLVPVLRGGGLFGVGNYDDGVYYAAATGLVAGRLPYRDFLLLHPPGIALVLAPFAAAAWLVGDPIGFGSARLAWMLLGAANTVLVATLGRRVGPAAALVGALWYAVSYPAVYAEHSTLLEGPATTALLAACCLLDLRRPSSGRAQRVAVAAAGVLLGVSTTLKLWGVVGVVIVVIWLVLSRRIADAARLLAGAAAAIVAICLPFFAAAPQQMWNEVVRDQLSRPRADTTILQRVADIAGLHELAGPHTAAASGLAAAGLVVAAALACTIPRARLWACLLLGLAGFLLTTPTWFLHYAGLTAAPIALTIGAATERLWVAGRERRALRLVVAGVLGGLIVTQGAAWSMITFGLPFPSRTFAAVTSAAPGCVTADDQTGLIETNTLSRNLRRGCPLVADLGGTSHDLRAAAGSTVSRNHNVAFQRYSLGYLGGGSRTILMRYAGEHGFNRCTTATLRGWPLLANREPYEVRQPNRAQPRCRLKPN